MPTPASAQPRTHRLRTTAALVSALALLIVPQVALAAASGGTSGSSGSGSGSKASAKSLSLGSTGTAVKRLQRKLHVRVTGYYGSATRAAVKRFQKRHGLTADGVAGPATLRALGVSARGASYATGGSAPSSGSSDSSGSSVQLPATLKRIAQCESGGNPRAISRDGRYRGKFQFDRSTWEAIGGSGDPAAASESTQDRLALRLYRKRGTAPWPNCA
jgi:peptidoglycan hydrolase-like protein with peptidoglycan-binding domain